MCRHPSYIYENCRVYIQKNRYGLRCALTQLPVAPVVQIFVRFEPEQE